MDKNFPIYADESPRYLKTFEQSSAVACGTRFLDTWGSHLHRSVSLLIVLLFVLPSFGGGEKVVTYAVGEAGSQVITSREVKISYFIDQAALLPAVGKVDKKKWLLHDGDENFKAHLNQILIEIMVKAEAESFSLSKVNSEDIHKEAELVVATLKDVPEWLQLEASQSEIEQIVVRRKMAKSFLKFKTESTGVIISDEAAKTYFEKNKVKFGSSQFIQFKDTIKEVLAQKELEEKLKDWFESLKRKYKLRFLRDQSNVSESKL